MTVSSSLSTQTFACNGSTTVFTCPFRVLEASELVGYLITIATNASVQLVNGTDFAVTGVGTSNAIATTTLTYSNAYQLNFRRRTQRLQSTDYRDNDPFPAESHENALDRLTHIAQENDADIGRALLAPEPETGITLPAANVRANLLLGFDSSGGPIAVAPVSGSAADLALSLASNSDPTKNAGQVGLNASLNYVLGTLGAAIKRFDPTLFPWLADPTGTDPADAAINACAAAAGANSRLDFPPGSTFRITDTLHHQHDFQTWVCYGSQFIYAPTANGICYERKAANPANSVWGGGLLGARFFSADSTYIKTAVEIYDARIFALRDLTINGSVVHGGTNFWSDGTSASIGLRIRGRELIETDNLYITADRPWVMSPSPNTAIVGVDHSTYTHTTLIAHQNPGVEIEDATLITQNTFAGRLSINLAREALKWIDTTGTVTGNGLKIQQLRAEQPEATSYPVLNIQMNGSARMQAVTLDGGFCNQAGPYLRGVDQVRLESWTHGLTGVNCLDVDATVSQIEAENCFWQTGATASTTGLRMMWGGTKAPNSAAPLPSSFAFQRADHVQRAITLGGGISETPITLANDATFDLGANLGGLLAVTTSEGFGAIFVVHGSQAVCELVSTTTSDAYFSNSAGTASKVNVYWDGSTYRVQNKRGGSRNIKFALLGSYGTF
jgi:hypothetical protein